MQARLLTLTLLLVVLVESFGVANTTAYGPYQQKPLEWAYSPGLISPEFQGLTVGQLGHWPMWEGGAAPRDIAGSNHTALPGGSSDPTWSVGQNGLLLDFDGSADHLTVGDIGAGEDQFFSYVARFEAPGSAGDDYIISEASTVDNNPIVAIQISSGVVRGFFRNTSGGSALVTGTTDVTSGVHTAIITGDGATLTLYVDGVSEGTPDGLPAPPHDTNATTIGALTRSSISSFFTGQIYYAAILDRNLTASEALFWHANPFGSITPDYLRNPDIAPGGETVVPPEPSTQNAYVYWW